MNKFLDAAFLWLLLLLGIISLPDLIDNIKPFMTGLAGVGAIVYMIMGGRRNTPDSREIINNICGAVIVFVVCGMLASMWLRYLFLSMVFIH